MVTNYRCFGIVRYGGDWSQPLLTPTYPSRPQTSYILSNQIGSPLRYNNIVDDLVKPRNFICFSNLTFRSDDQLHCPSLSFGELSCLTLKPREPPLCAVLDNLQHKIPVRTLFLFSKLLSVSISSWLNHSIALTYGLQLKMNECKIICIQKL